MSWSEERIHRWLAGRQRPGALVGSQQHDAAVLRAVEGRPVLCTDQVVEGVHVRRDAQPREAGAKAVLRTLSDLAATGATPVAVLLAVRCGPDRDDRFVRGLISGAARAAARHGAELVGGDLAQGPGPYSLAVTAHGVLPGRKRPLGRDRGRSGQVLVCTGGLGGSLAGRHLRPRPRLEAGRSLHAFGATAAIDVSDGFARDLHRLAAASGLDAIVEHVPIHADARRAGRESGREPIDHALRDGEDHELIAALSARSAERWLEGPAPAAACRVGRLVSRRNRSRSQVWLARDGGDPVPLADLGGYLHGVPR